MTTRVFMLLAVFLFGVFLSQPHANAGGVDRHIFDGHAGSLVTNLSNKTNASNGRSAAQQSCFYDLLTELDQLSLSLLNTIVENLPLEWWDCQNLKGTAVIG